MASQTYYLQKARDSTGALRRIPQYIYGKMPVVTLDRLKSLLYVAAEVLT
jgi:hypothetical protein